MFSWNAVLVSVGVWKYDVYFGTTLCFITLRYKSLLTHTET
jgi:hypothetical protein